MSTDGTGFKILARVALGLYVVFVALPFLIFLALRPFGLLAPPTVGGSMGAHGRLDLQVLDEDVKAADLHVGDVISFRRRDTNVLHRIVAILPGPAYVTKGDANDSVDRPPVTTSQIRARRVATIPFLNALFGFASRGPELTWLAWLPVTSPLVLAFLGRRWMRGRTSDGQARRAITGSLRRVALGADWVGAAAVLERAYALDLTPSMRLRVAADLAATLPHTGSASDMERARALHDLVVAEWPMSDYLVVTGALISVRSGRTQEAQAAIPDLERVLGGSNRAEKPRARLVLQEAEGLLASASPGAGV